MVEYTVETLVHLYDNLNNQIENIRNNLNDFNSIRDTKSEFKTNLETAYTKAEKRLEKLMNMRDDVEELLNRILEAEVNE